MKLYNSELAQFVNRRRRYPTAIIQYPSGRYGIVGTVPAVLCENGRSKSWGTEDEVKSELIAIGLPFFQLNNCTWHPRKPETQVDAALLDSFWNL